MGSFPYYLSSRNISYGHLYSSFTVMFIFFSNSLFGTISIQSHDLGYTGTNAMTRIYSTKGQKTEQREKQPQSPVLQELSQKKLPRLARAQLVLQRSALFEILVQPDV